jgi:hypothetical protein
MGSGEAETFTALTGKKTYHEPSGRFCLPAIVELVAICMNSHLILSICQPLVSQKLDHACQLGLELRRWNKLYGLERPGFRNSCLA